MRISLAVLAAVSCLAFDAGSAEAHYLFIRITPPAEGGRAAEVYFSERAEAGDPRFIDKVASVRLWRQSSPGEFQPLETRRAADRLRAALPGSGAVVVHGALDYGVLARGGAPFLLRHYPKAMSGNPADLARMKPRPETPLEIVGTLEGGQLALAALLDGKPLADAVFHTIDEDLANEELKGDGEGRTSWTPPAAGNYSVYIEHVRKERGEASGKAYDEVREFATLNFNWPLAHDEGDAEAVSQFEEALATRAVWRDFPGFSARADGVVDDRQFGGKVVVAADGSVQAAIEDETARDWVEDQLGSLAMHRGAGAPRAAAARPKPVLWFADRADDHPLGRLLIFQGGEFASSYRVKDRQIAVVNRALGAQNMTITVLENDKNADGLYLPRSYTVHYWDAAGGNLQRTETIQDRWQRLQTWDLPTQHIVATASEQGFSLRSLRLSGHVVEGAAASK